MGAGPLGDRKNNLFISYILDVILMHILNVILMHILDVRIRIHILDVLLLVLATMAVASLFGEFQPQSNNSAGSVFVPKTTVLSVTTVLKHKYALSSQLQVYCLSLLVCVVYYQEPKTASLEP